MLLTLTLTGVEPATDLGYLLHKHPDRVQAFEVSAGRAEVFYPVAEPARCTAALAVELDPIGLVRRRGGDAGFALGQYVNDRPYAASSMLAVALGKVFRTAMSGRCDSRPELAARPLLLSVEVFAVPTDGGVGLVRRLFEPLGWRVDAEVVPADPELPSWGPSRYVNLTLTGTVRLADALTQLYVLLPVLDDTKHYWVGDAEVEKLLRAGESWLPRHPDRELITRRYLAHQRSLVGSAYERLLAADDIADDAIAADERDTTEDPPARTPLRDERVRATLDTLRAADARTVVDLGCGEGRLVSALLSDRAYDKVVGVDVSPRTLESAARRLRLDRMSEREAARVAFFQSSLTYRDDRLRGFDAGVLCEVVEHLDPERLPALEANVFGYARPGTVVVTTPNADYNERYESLTEQGFRHRDHRFEWTREEFAAWTERITSRYAYTATIIGVGEPDERLGSPTQAAIFRTTEPTDAAREVAA